MWNINDVLFCMLFHAVKVCEISAVERNLTSNRIGFFFLLLSFYCVQTIMFFKAKCVMYFTLISNDRGLFLVAAVDFYLVQNFRDSVEYKTYDNIILNLKFKHLFKQRKLMLLHIWTLIVFCLYCVARHRLILNLAPVSH